MRRTLLASLVLALAACGQPEAPPPLPAPAQATAPATWFICDAIGAPVLLTFTQTATGVTVTQYEKPSGATVQTTSYTIGDEEGAAGSLYTTLLQNGAEAGVIRQTNAGMLESPDSAYTPRFPSVRIGEREIACRWMPRTRLMGFTGRRTIIVSEDRDGDLLYHSYDFATAADAQPIELSENGETTTFSLEARDGAETTDANGSRYTFRADAETEIVVSAPRTGAATVEVRRHGPNPVQTEDLIAYIQGGAGAE